MIENAPGIYKAPIVYNQGGGGGGWQLSNAWIGTHKYQTIKNGKVEWMAQNLNEVFTGLSLSDHLDVYAPKDVYRKGMITTDYPAGGIEELAGVCYKGEARPIILNNVSADGWRIPSKTDWLNLFDGVNNELEKLFMPITKCDYSKRLGTNETGMSLIGLTSPGGDPSTNAEYITSAGGGGTSGYMVTVLFYNCHFQMWYNENNSIWYSRGYCRLVRNL